MNKNISYLLQTERTFARIKNHNIVYSDEVVSNDGERFETFEKLAEYIKEHDIYNHIEEDFDGAWRKLRYTIYQLIDDEFVTDDDAFIREYKCTAEQSELLSEHFKNPPKKQFCWRVTTWNNHHIYCNPCEYLTQTSNEMDKWIDELNEYHYDNDNDYADIIDWKVCLCSDADELHEFKTVDEFIEFVILENEKYYSMCIRHNNAT